MAYPKQKSGTQDMEALKKEIQENTPKRVYLFFGEEPYLICQFRANLMKALAGDEESMNLNIHRETPTDLDALQDQALTLPFFAEHRLIIVEDSGLFSSGKIKKGTGEDTGDEPNTAGEGVLKVQGLLGKLPESTVLLFTENSVDKRSKLYKSVQKEGRAVEFCHPDDTSLRRWVLGQLKRDKIQISAAALDRFMELAGNDMSHMSGEIQKLTAYAGEGGSLSAADVDALVSARLENHIFDMIDALAHRDRKKALNLYDDLIRLREEPMKILALIVRQFNLLLQTKELMRLEKGQAQMLDSLGLSSGWILRKYTGQAQFFSLQFLRTAVEECAKTEEYIKTGRIDQRMGVELLIVRFSQPQEKH